jgi:hypothetical protein
MNENGKPSGKGGGARTNGRRVVGTYDYHDAGRKLVYQTLRYEPKDFRQRRPDGKRGWIWNLDGVPRVLYRLPQLIAAPKDRPVYIVEGEKDADALIALGRLATTSPMGSGKWRPEYSEQLRGRNVFILPDNDEAGRKHAAAVERSLHGVAESVLIVELPDLPDKGDVSDWLGTGGDKDKLLALIAKAVRKPPAGPAPEPAPADPVPDPASPEPWEAPLPLGGDYPAPPFPVDRLPGWMAAWVEAEALATQTPAYLPGLLVLTFAAAALAMKFRVRVREGWAEPLNLYTVVALPPGERKSPVFADASVPVQAFEEAEWARLAPAIAEAASEHRMLEARLKAAEAKAAKEDNATEAEALRTQAKELARKLAEHTVPEDPVVYCDDETPESLSKLLADHGGRMLQASAEGTAFEIAKGRYSDSANFDVYLKAHAGDPLRVGRVGRVRESVEQPALSVALAVQPDVVRGLADQASMRGRGFLARFLYGLPCSRVGARDVSPPPVPKATAKHYQDVMLALWRLKGPVNKDGKAGPHWLNFSADDDAKLAEFERRLEPLLAPGKDLSPLAGWGNKLAGAVARIAGVLHVAAAEGVEDLWATSIGAETVVAAIHIAEKYLIPHAQAAFGLMGAEPRLDDARRVLEWLARKRESVHSVNGVHVCSKRDVHAKILGSRYGVDDAGDRRK